MNLSCWENPPSSLRSRRGIRNIEAPAVEVERGPGLEVFSLVLRPLTLKFSGLAAEKTATAALEGW